MFFYIVSGHGGRQNVQAASSSISPVSKIVIPDGFEVVFYTQDDEILYDDDAFAIYTDLTTTGRTSRPKRVACADVYDYFCYSYPQYPKHNHVVSVAPSTPGASASAASSMPTAATVWTSTVAQSLEDISRLQPLHLSALFKQFAQAPGPIHWLACTEVTVSKVVKLA